MSVAITSASRKVPLVAAFRDAFLSLNLAGTVWAGDSDDRAPAARCADRFWPMPRLADLSIEHVRDFCRRNGIRLVVPTRDGELAWWSAVASELEVHGVQVAVSPPPCIAVCDDKLAFAAACNAAGVRAVPTSTDLTDLDGDRVVVKERNGAGSTGLGLDLDPVAAEDHARFLRQPIFQPMVRGDEFTVDVYVRRDGVALGAVARRRDVVWAGESQVSTVEATPDLERTCSELASVLGIRGHAVMQAIGSPDGFWLLECNPRIGGASTLSFAAGLHTPQFLLQELLGELPEAPGPPAAGLRLLRHPKDHVVFPQR